MNVLGIITARGGSKGIPKKNLLRVGGHSLLEYTVRTANKSKLSRIILSTDDPEIASHGKSLGVDVPFMRPLALAGDNTPTLPVLQDVVHRLELLDEHYDAIFTLQPTNPLRIASDIDGAIALMQRTNCDSVIGFTDVGECHPARMKYIRPNGRVIDPPFAEEFEGQRRQDLRPLFLRDGAVYLTRRDVLMIKNSIKGDDSRAWLIPKERALNIDEMFDIKRFEWLLSMAQRIIRAVNLMHRQ